MSGDNQDENVATIKVRTGGAATLRSTARRFACSSTPTGCNKRTGDFFLESRGEDVRKILEGGKAHSGWRPVYELFGNELRLTVWARRD